jgi:hypothetical protein
VLKERRAGLGYVIIVDDATVIKTHHGDHHIGLVGSQVFFQAPQDSRGIGGDHSLVDHAEGHAYVPLIEGLLEKGRVLACGSGFTQAEYAIGVFLRKSAPVLVALKRNKQEAYYTQP